MGLPHNGIGADEGTDRAELLRAEGRQKPLGHFQIAVIGPALGKNIMTMSMALDFDSGFHQGFYYRRIIPIQRSANK